MQQPVRLLKGHLFHKIKCPIVRRQKHPNMPDKQDGFLLGRLVVEEHSNEAYSFILPERNTPGSPFLLHSLNMM